MTTDFSNGRRMAHVMCADDPLTLEGEMQHSTADNRITNFNGGVSGGSANAGFYYAEQTDGRITYNITAEEGMKDEVETMMFAAVKDIHTEYDTEG